MTIELQPGDLFDGRYLVQSLLGEGGFATVWLAKETGSAYNVALKVLHPDDGGGYEPRTRARVEREMRLVAGLQSPYTVRLFRYGECDGVLYMVFEHVPGRDLSALLHERGRLHPDEAVHVLRQVLESLREAHDAGLIHRDIKPQNIRVFADGGDPLRVKVLDFGIARPTDDGSPALTRTGELLGTPRYMSPEQLRERPLTPASDIYTVGVLAFEMLAGQDALTGSSLGDQLGRLQSGHLFSAPELERSGRLMQIVQKMTAPEVEVRFPSAAAVLAALDEPTPTRPASRPAAKQPVNPDAPRSRPAWFVPLALASLAIVAAGGLVVATRDEPAPRPVAPAQVRDPGVLVRQPELPVIDPVPDAGSDATGTTDLTAPGPVARDGAIASLGCGTTAVQAGMGTFARRSVRYLPMRYDGRTPMPLVVMLHSDYQNPANFLESIDFPARADRDDVILLAVADGNELGGHVWRDGRDDFNKIVAQAETAMAEFCVDRSRVFVVGHGDGGRMAHRISCRPSVAGVAINAFSMSSGGEMCDRPVPALWLFPMKSVHVPTDGSENCSGNRKRTVDEMETMWRERNRCKGPGEAAVRYGESTCRRWNCRARLETCRLDGGVPWPGDPTPPFSQLMGCKPDKAPDFPTSARIWEFFLKTPPLTEVPELF